MKNLVQDGNTVELTAPADVEPGDIVNVGVIIGIAVHGALTGDPVQTRLEGVFNKLPLKAGDAFTAGVLTYYDAAAKMLTTTVGSNKKFGVALGGGKFRLNGSF
ncbi:hypothetical protein Amn_23600 [Aminobacter sp. Y103A]|uniref:DUF2190 family protein n=1 Tax=Aminobacter sp. Y103A TaxID=1870862 RepID=UPI0025735965|nr:DUF2190 family protein [Aminobacter sp. SS-2016]BBD37480.1 hypothetical protein Amn_23600 [Aminobacter sp. SS-2016]